MSFFLPTDFQLNLKLSNYYKPRIPKKKKNRKNYQCQPVLNMVGGYGCVSVSVCVYIMNVIYIEGYVYKMVVSYYVKTVLYFKIFLDILTDLVVV